MRGAVWRIYWITWLTNGALIGIDIAWGMRAGLTVRRDEVIVIVIRCLASLAVGVALLAASQARRFRSTHREAFYRDAGTTIFWIVTLAVFICGALVFQYLSLTMAAPDIAAKLLAADARLGIHWLALYDTVRAHRWLDVTLSVAYQSAFVQLALVPFILAVTHNVRDYAKFVVQFMIASALVLAIATPFPAESAFIHFHIQAPDTLSTVSDYTAFRSGQLRELSFREAQGLVSFPSFHTAIAMLFAYAMRHVRRVFPIAIGVNVLMVIATPVHGGHYVVDVIGGLAVGAIALWITRKLFARTAPPEPMPIFAAGRT